VQLELSAIEERGAVVASSPRATAGRYQAVSMTEAGYAALAEAPTEEGL
jgi:hypothetical protein